MRRTFATLCGWPASKEMGSDVSERVEAARAGVFRQRLRRPNDRLDASGSLVLDGRATVMVSRKRR
jgi:hypothetical protein